MRIGQLKYSYRINVRFTWIAMGDGRFLKDLREPVGPAGLGDSLRNDDNESSPAQTLAKYL